MATVDMAKEATPVSMNAYETLKYAAELWGFVQEEQAEHKTLVSEQEWRQWVSYDAETSKTLDKAISKLDNNLQLPADVLASLKRIIDTVKQAKRLDSIELVERNMAESTKTRGLVEAQEALQAKYRS